MRKSIAIDMDQVLANMYKKMTAIYNELFNENFTEEQFINAPRSAMTKEQGIELFKALNEPNFFRDLEVLDRDAIEVVRELNERFDVYIATAAMEVPGSFNAKYDWLQQHFPFLDSHKFVFCGTKAVIHTDYLIDDSPNQLEAFKGTGILYSMPYNANVEGYTRANNWAEIRTIFNDIN
jgi:5'(3')-deoxyribonucleotidase